jgi:hypothetical protein
VNKDGGVEDPVRVEVEVLDALVPKHPLEEVASRQRKSTLHEPRNIGISSRFFSIGHKSPVVVRQRSISFSWRNPLLTKVRMSSVFSFSFFHSFTGLGRGDEGADDDDWPASPASSRLLFFNTPVFLLFARDPFTLQVTGVFTHIRSGDAEGADYGGSRK